MAHLPIDEVKKAATAVALSCNVVDGVFADGKVDFKDLARLPELLTALSRFSDVDAAKLLPQVADIEDAEVKELGAHFAAVFNLSNDTIEGLVEEGLNILLEGLEAFQTIRGLIARLKG